MLQVKSYFLLSNSSIPSGSVTCRFSLFKGRRIWKDELLQTRVSWLISALMSQPHKLKSCNSSVLLTPLRHKTELKKRNCSKLTKKWTEALEKKERKNPKIPIEDHISDIRNKKGMFNMALSQGGFVGLKRMSDTEQVRKIQGSWGNARSCKARGEPGRLLCSWDGNDGTLGGSDTLTLLRGDAWPYGMYPWMRGDSTSNRTKGGTIILLEKNGFSPSLWGRRWQVGEVVWIWSCWKGFSRGILLPGAIPELCAHNPGPAGAGRWHQVPTVGPSKLTHPGILCWELQLRKCPLPTPISPVFHLIHYISNNTIKEIIYARKLINSRTPLLSRKLVLVVFTQSGNF